MLKSQSPFLSKQFYFFSIFPFLLSCFAQNLQYINTNTDSKYLLVYKNCGNGSLADSTNSPPEILSTLFNELLEKSSKSKFYQTNIANKENAISGMYQCRNDLSQDDCQRCLKRIPNFSKTLCGTQIPSRIHLSGCYMHYKKEGYENSRLEVQHKKCGGEGGFEGYGDTREKALKGVGDCVVEGEGYCDTRYEGIHVLAQCGGDLGHCECGECIGYAEETLRGECKYSISGEVYLDGCFVSFSRYEDEDHGYSKRDYGEERIGSGKLVAIAVGGVALLSLGAMFLYFFKSCRNKSDE